MNQQIFKEIQTLKQQICRYEATKSTNQQITK